MKKTITITGMTCGHCVKRVEKALLAVEGITSVTVNLDDKRAEIETAIELADQLLVEVIDEAGYDVESIN